MNAQKVFTIPIDIRFKDLDSLGHVNHAVFITYFEEGRKAFFQKFFDVRDASELNFIMAHVRCDYLKPIQLSHRRVTLQMQVSKMGNKSFDLEYRLIDPTDPDAIFATGASVQVCFDYQDNKSVRMSDKMRAILLEYA
jgi:acyl-CoA thioester hydrolase